MDSFLDMVDGKGRFMAADTQFDEAEAVIIGAPMDYTVSFRPGSRFGPSAIRDVSEGLEEYSVYQDKDLTEISYMDAGDLLLPFGNVQRALDKIEAAMKILFAEGKKPLLLGGEHLVSLPAIRAAYAKYPDLRVIHLDAHTDLRQDYMGEALSHATVMRHVTEMLGDKRLIQLGIRSGMKAEFDYAKAHNLLFRDQVLAPLQELLPQLQSYPIYFSLDIDVVDPAFAPGTGTPESGGCDGREIIETMGLLRQMNIVGFDLVEVAPVYDASGCTALLAAKLVREALLAFCKVRRG
jgi:agmatinase